jgi:hypothetical protein
MVVSIISSLFDSTDELFFDLLRIYRRIENKQEENDAFHPATGL